MRLNCLLLILLCAVGVSAQPRTSQQQKLNEELNKARRSIDELTVLRKDAIKAQAKADARANQIEATLAQAVAQAATDNAGKDRVIANQRAVIAERTAENASLTADNSGLRKRNTALASELGTCNEQLAAMTAKYKHATKRWPALKCGVIGKCGK